MDLLQNSVNMTNQTRSLYREETDLICFKIHTHVRLIPIYPRPNRAAYNKTNNKTTKQTQTYKDKRSFYQ